MLRVILLEGSVLAFGPSLCPRPDRRDSRWRTDRRPRQPYVTSIRPMLTERDVRLAGDIGCVGASSVSGVAEARLAEKSSRAPNVAPAGGYRTGPPGRGSTTLRRPTHHVNEISTTFTTSNGRRTMIDRLSPYAVCWPRQRNNLGGRRRWRGRIALRGRSLPRSAGPSRDVRPRSRGLGGESCRRCAPSRNDRLKCDDKISSAYKNIRDLSRARASGSRGARSHIVPRRTLPGWEGRSGRDAMALPGAGRYDGDEPSDRFELETGWGHPCPSMTGRGLTRASSIISTSDGSLP